MCLQVFLQGRENLNRAVSDDIVAVEILPRDEWVCPSSLLLEDEQPVDSNDTESVRIALSMFNNFVISLMGSAPINVDGMFSHITPLQFICCMEQSPY